MISSIHVWCGGVDVTSEVQNFTCDAIVNGGYSSAGFVIPLNSAAKLRHLMVVRCTYGHRILWEGVIEDMDASQDYGRVRVTCFGWKRVLEQSTLQRIWSKRDMGWSPLPMGAGADWAPFSGFNYQPTLSQSLTGVLNESSFADYGAGFKGTGQLNNNLVGNAVEWILPVAQQLNGRQCKGFAIKGGLTFAGGNVGAGAAKMSARISLSGDHGATWSTSSFTASGAFNITATPFNRVRLAWVSNGACTPLSTDSILFTNVRVIGGGLYNDLTIAAVTEDDDATNGGGFYGHTLIRDVLNSIPGVSPGEIDSNSSFVIPQLERSSRDSALSILEEISSYYDVWWGVFENAQFNWKNINRQAPAYVIDIKESVSWEASRSIDRMAKVVIVQYRDAASGYESEVSATAQVSNSPYSRWQYSKDVVVRTPFPMTSNTAQGLAAAIGASLKEPILRGSITLPLNASASGVRPAPYAWIRPGDVVNIPGLPRLGESQMGMNIVLVAGTSIDIDAQTITLTLGDEPRTADILTARLLAVTTALTGS